MLSLRPGKSLLQVTANDDGVIRVADDVTAADKIDADTGASIAAANTIAANIDANSAPNSTANTVDAPGAAANTAPETSDTACAYAGVHVAPTGGVEIAPRFILRSLNALHRRHPPPPTPNLVRPAAIFLAP